MTNTDRRVLMWFVLLIACVVAGASVSVCTKVDGGEALAPSAADVARPTVVLGKAELVRKARRCTKRHPCRRRASRSAPRAARHHDDIFDDLAHCESGHRNVTGQRYDGYFQFSPATWRSLGYSGRAYDHSYEVQKEGARRLVARSGWGQFPVCSRRIGAR